MFIPTWLLVLVVVLVLCSLWRRVWDALVSSALAIFGLSVVASIPAVIYFGAFKNDTQTAIIVSVPLIILTAWGAISGFVETFRTSLPIHNLRVRLASHPARIQELRRSYAKAIDLPLKIWQLREAVKYFPSWYIATGLDGKPWSSNVIPPTEISDVLSHSDSRFDGFDFSAVGDPPFLVFRFSTAGKEYAFCSRDHVTLHGETRDSDGEPLEGCGAWVIEAPNRVVLSIRLAYYCGSYGDTLCREHCYVEAFKPDTWLRTLLDIARRVKEDESQKHEQWRKKWERQQAEKNFVL